MWEKMEKKGLKRSAVKADLKVPLDVEWVWDYESEQVVVISAKISDGFKVSARDVYVHATPASLKALDHEIAKSVLEKDLRDFKRAAKTGDLSARIRLPAQPAKAWGETAKPITATYHMIPVSIIAEIGERHGIYLEPRLEGRPSVVIVGEGTDEIQAFLQDFVKHPQARKFEVEVEDGYTRLVWPQ